MNRRSFVILSVALIITAILSSVSFVLVYAYTADRATQDMLSAMSTKPLEGVPPSLYVCSYMPVGQHCTGSIVNATQGTTQQLNLTLYSMYTRQITVPLENLTLIAYNSTLDIKTWNTNAWNTSVVQETVFSYSFGQNELILQPNMPSSTILTIHWADDAPTGGYVMCFNSGKAEPAIPPILYSDAAGQSLGFIMAVYPKGT